MSRAPANDHLEQLLRQRPDLWRGRMRPARAVLGSGRAWLDAQLPHGGWPCGKLTEWLPSKAGSGELGLLLPMLAEQTRQGLPVLFAAPPWVPCPQALAGAGMDLSRLVITRQPEQALWAAEQGLKSGLCGVVMVWHPPGRVQPKSIRRLQLAAENGDAPAFICYRPGQQPPPSMAALRLAISPGSGIEILRGNNGIIPIKNSEIEGNVIALSRRKNLARNRHRPE